MLTRALKIVSFSVALSACGGTVNGAGGGSGGLGSREPTRHRKEPASCPSEVLAGPSLPCASDAECTAGPLGRCVPSGGSGTCTYQSCIVDGDCGVEQVCECGSDGYSHHCVSAAGCAKDADCPNSWCSPTFGSCGSFSGVVAYECHTPEDRCIDDADCASGGGYCMYEPTAGYWLCNTGVCVG